MRWIILYFIFLCSALAEEEEKTRVVTLDEGVVVATKYWDGDFYEFFGVPYAEVPTGRDRYQAPLPVKPWKGPLSANIKNIVCHQSYFTDTENEDGEYIMSGDDDCLVINLYVPEIASEDNLLPVVVYVHSGAFSGGNGNMARFHYIARHDIIAINFNYRLGALGFACLGNKEIPGNAGLKDQVAALRWIKKNIKKFGGDPNKVTLAGFSVGASMAELLSLSKTTDGLIDQLILDSASGLSPFAVNRDPIGTAKNLALAMGYNGTDTLEELTEFYLNASADLLSMRSLNFFLPNSTFGYSPCIENIHKGIEPFLTESPMDILRSGRNRNIPVLIGFANMEGISRTIKFGEWREQMTRDFSNFLPADLIFDDDKKKKAVVAEIKKLYFKGEEVNNEKLQNYIDYFSDAMFKYSIIKSLRLRATVSKRKIYLYEFSYVGKLNMQHNYMDRVKGASHRDQTAYILDFFGFANNINDLDMRDRMTIMWTDFVKYGDPTAFESAVVTYKWLPYTNENQNYLQITRKPKMKKNLFTEGYNFWNKIYEKYYWNPTAPEQPKAQNVKKKLPEVNQTDKTDKNNKPVDSKKNKVEGNNETKDPKLSNEKKKEKENMKKKEIVEDTKKKDKQPKQKTAKNKSTDKQNKNNNHKDKQETVKEKKQVKDTKNKDNKFNKEKKAETIKEHSNLKPNDVKEKKIIEQILKEHDKVVENIQKQDNQFKPEATNVKKSVKENNKENK